MKNEFLNTPLENTSYYEALKNMVKEGKLTIKLILSPPRTGSTLMESSFSKNGMIDAHVHEPFIVLRKVKAEVGYKKIYDTVCLLKKESTQQKHLVIKEMSHWLMTNNEHEHFLELVEIPIIILIRNPLLNTESRIKKILETLDLREKPAVQETLLNYYAQSKGTDNWQALLRKYASVSDNLIDDEAVKLYRDFKHRKSIPESELFPLQRWLLDYYAISKGYGRWRAMLSEVFDNKNYNEFKEILRDNRIYDVAGTGWKATGKLLSYLHKVKKLPLIVDCSDYRLAPEVIVPVLCKKWGIPFSEDMINWGDKGSRLYTDQTKLHQSIWYDRLQHSKNIEPPAEIAAVIEDFPEFIIEHLRDVDLPVYVSMMSSVYRIKPQKLQILKKNIAVPVKRGLHKRLIDIGLLPKETDIKSGDKWDQRVFNVLLEKGILKQSHSDTTKSLLESNCKYNGNINLTIQDIDPVFAYLSDNTLLNDPEFRRINHRYLPTIELINEIQRQKIRTSFN